MARLKEIVFDCEHPAALARFWAGVLEGYAVRAYDAAEIARLAALGFTPETDPVVMVDGPGPSLCFQKRAAAAPRGPIHLDVVAAGPLAEEIARIAALGGAVAETRDGYAIMTDPEGTRFCVQTAGNQPLSS
jgi:hypothetical protein